MAYYLDKFIISIDENEKEIKTPVSAKERADFIVEYNHNKGLKFVQTETQFIALEENEVYRDGKVVIDEEYYKKKEEEAKKKEAERIANLNMTRGDFIEGLILAQGKDDSDIISEIQKLELSDLEKKVYIARVKNAQNFYRGYPVIDTLCPVLGISTDDMTKFFETKDYTYLTENREEKLI